MPSLINHLRYLKACANHLDGKYGEIDIQERQETIEEMQETIQEAMDMAENLMSYAEKGLQVEKLMSRMDQIEENTERREARLQQIEDTGLRAVDFIKEHGLTEQFRQYYKKKKQTNVVIFPAEQ